MGKAFHIVGKPLIPELQQDGHLSSFPSLIMLWYPSAFIFISYNAVVVSCNMDNSIWIKNATQHNPGMKFWQRSTLCNSVFIYCLWCHHDLELTHSLYLFGTPWVQRVFFWCRVKLQGRGIPKISGPPGWGQGLVILGCTQLRASPGIKIATLKFLKNIFTVIPGRYQIGYLLSQ